MGRTHAPRVRREDVLPVLRVDTLDAMGQVSTLTDTRISVGENMAKISFEGEHGTTVTVHLPEEALEPLSGNQGSIHVKFG